MRSKHWIHYRRIIVLGGSVLCIFLLVYLFRNGQSTVEKFPEQLGSLHRVEVRKDDDAKKLFFEKYTPSLQPTQYWAFRYGSADGFATIYALRYRSENDVKSEIAVLQQKIQSGATYYSHSRQFEYGKKTIYLFLGFGKAHYVLMKDVYLYWVEADIPTAQSTLTQVVNFLNTK